MISEDFNYEVSWFDFTPLDAKPANAKDDAEIKVNHLYKYGIGTDNRNKVIPIDVEVRVKIEPGSWVLRSQITNDLMKHEQGHYDITALAAREFEKEVLTKFGNSDAILKETIKNLNVKYVQKIKKINERYDKQTDHSKKKDEQIKWNQSIANEKGKDSGSIDNLPG